MKENSDKSNRLESELSLVPQRLAGYLIFESILILAFAEIMAHSLYLSQVLCILGIISAFIGIVNFADMLIRIIALEQTKRGLGWMIMMPFHGRSLGITCSIIFFIFWAFAIKWAFC